MQMPLDITFRDMTPSAALATTIEDLTRKLDEAVPLTRCAVVVERPHKHRRHGAPFLVHLDLSIPGTKIAVTRGSHESRDPYLAVADAFRAARRQLMDFVAQRREARPATGRARI